MNSKQNSPTKDISDTVSQSSKNYNDNKTAGIVKRKSENSFGVI